MRESAEHAESVLVLAERMRADGVECAVAPFDAGEADGWPARQARDILDAEFVLVVCSPALQEWLDGTTPPSGSAAATQASVRRLYGDPTRRGDMVPVVLNGDLEPAVPRALSDAPRYRLPRDYAALLPRLGRPVQEGEELTALMVPVVPDAVRPEQEEATARVAFTGPSSSGASRRAPTPPPRPVGLVVALIVAIMAALGAGVALLSQMSDGGDSAAAAAATTTAGEGAPAAPAAIAPVATASVSVEVKPADAFLFVDGVLWDGHRIPDVQVGRRLKLELKRANYEPWTRELVVASSPETLRVTLKPTPVELTFTAPDVGSAHVTVEVDGRAVGSAPATYVGLPGTEIRVSARADGFLPFELSHRIERPERVSLALRRQASLTVSVVPAEATLFVDDEPVAAAPDAPGTFRILGHAEGDTVTLRAEARGFDSTTRRMTLGASGQESIELVRKVQAVARTAVQINARPWADVYWHGRKVGRTPYTGTHPVDDLVFELRKGEIRRRVQLSAKGGGPVRHVADMSAP